MISRHGRDHRNAALAVNRPAMEGAGKSARSKDKKMFNVDRRSGLLSCKGLDFTRRLTIQFAVVCFSFFLGVGMARAIADPMFEHAKVLSFQFGEIDSDLPNLDLKLMSQQIADEIGNLLSKSLQNKNKKLLVVVTSPAKLREMKSSIEENRVVYLTVDILAKRSSDLNYAVVATFKLGRSIGGEPTPGAKVYCNCQARAWSDLAFEKAANIDTKDEFALFLYKEFFPTIEQKLKKQNE